MNRTEDVDTALRRYLLGELSEPERAALETEYFANRETLEEVCAVENDLIDDYVRGNLTDAEQELFEQQYCSSPARLRRIQFGETMLSSLFEIPATPGTGVPPEPAPRTVLGPFDAVLSRWRLRMAPALAGLALILTVAVGLLGLECLRLKQRLTASEQAVSSQSQRERELERQLGDLSATSGQLAKDLDDLRSQKEREQNNPPGAKLPAIVAAFALKLGSIRGSGEPQVLMVAQDADVVELRLELGNLDFKKYSATLQTPEGTELWRQSEVRVRPSQIGGRAVIRVPARRLPPGDYVLRLDGISPSGEAVEVSDCYFRVVRKAAH